MRIARIRSKSLAFTLIELIVIIGILVLLVLVLAPAMRDARTKAHRIDCLNNLKQVGVSFRIWSDDSASRFAMMVPTNEGGTLEVANDVWRTFLVMSNELGTPKVLCCPSDNRSPANSWTSLANTNISYFIGLNADEGTPDVPLSGDRNLTNSRSPVDHLLTVTKNDLIGWTATMHDGCGNIVFSDGSAQLLDIPKLHQALTNAPMRLALPE